MKHLIVILLFLFAAMQLSAEETSKVSVTSAEVNNGVVILNVVDGNSKFELQCNEAMPSCKKLKPGKYTMVRLAKGRGMYECDNVDIYLGDPQNEERTGQYCAIKP